MSTGPTSEQKHTADFSRLPKGDQRATRTGTLLQHADNQLHHHQHRISHPDESRARTDVVEDSAQRLCAALSL
jgi:hypothetical protein